MTGWKPDGLAKDGFIHLINSGAVALDASGECEIDGKPAMKPYWDISAQEAAKCMDATQYCYGDLGYFRGGGYSSHLKSRGGMPVTMTRMNLIAWARFGLLAVKEVLIRIGIAYPLQSLVDAYRRINIYLTNYLKELEKIDFEAFEKETARYNELTVLLSKAKTEEDLHAVLTSQYEALGIPLPYKEKTFDDFMENPSSRLEFK